jgi:hypothetical protein
VARTATALSLLSRIIRGSQPLMSASVTSVAAKAAPPTTDAWSPKATFLGCAALSAGLALLVAFAAPRGNDYAAHLYQLHVFRSRGLTSWTNYWYAGQYTFWTYSLLTYPLAAVVGLPLLGVASVTAASGSAAILLGRAWGPASRLAAWTFAVLWPTYLMSADFPFILGAALALGALVCLQSGGRGRIAAFAILTLASLAASPLAFVGIALIVAALGLSRRLTGARLALSWAVVAVGGGAELLTWRAFPYGGIYPFWGPDYFSALAFTAVVALLAWRAPWRRELLALCALYALVCTALFLIPTAAGANVVRVQYVALTIMVAVAALRRWQPRLLCVVAVVLAGLWTLVPQRGGLLSESAPTAAAASPAYWAPAVAYLRAHLEPDQRVEAVDIQNHWDALYLSEAGIPIARGWYRQDDFPLNAFLYHPFAPATYRAWLRRLGIAYVVDSTARPDFSASEEARIVSDGSAGLHLVEHSATVDVYAVADPEPLLTGPGEPRVLVAGAGSYRLSFSRAGRYDMAVRWNPYWNAPGICAGRQPDGLTTLYVTKPGTVVLRMEISPLRVLSAILGSAPSGCSGRPRT